MPLYEYECNDCEHRFERIQKFSDPLVSSYPVCDGEVRKLLSSPAIQFKGTGWYVTDYAKKASGEAKDGAPKDGGKKDGGKKDGGKKDGSSKGADGKDAGASRSKDASSSASKRDSTASASRSSSDSAAAR